MNSTQLTIERYEQREEQANRLINQSVEQLIPLVASVLATLSDKQAEELLQNIGFKTKEKSRKKKSTETLQQKQKKRKKFLKKKRKSTEKSLKKWFGSVNPVQREIISQWVNKTVLPEDWSDPQWQQQQDQRFQQLKQQAIHILENQRDNPEVIAGYLRELIIVDNEHLTDYQKQHKKWQRQLTVDLLASITETQQRHLQKKLSRMADTIRSLNRNQKD